MTKLIKCKACEREISPNAASCPNCGEKLKTEQTAIGLLAAIIIALGVGLVLYFAVTGR
jgi:RNA polymerase subunit RPABC4/transcription elongation factor Spt4